MRKIHLTKRGQRYFYRRRVPDELRSVLGRNEIKKALGTSDFSEARRLGAIETVRTDELFRNARTTVMQQVAPEVKRRTIRYQEALPLVARWIEEMEQQSVDWSEEDLDIQNRPDDLQEALRETRTREHVLSGGGLHYFPENGRHAVKCRLEEHGFEFQGSPDEFKRLAGLFRRASLENARRDLAFLAGSDEDRTLTIYLSAK